MATQGLTGKTLAAAALLLALGLASAQEEGTAPAAGESAPAEATAPEASAPADSGMPSNEGPGIAPAEGEAAPEAVPEAAGAPAKPQKSEILPKASQAVTLDVTHTGEGYVAVGERGHVLLSADGKTWTQSQTPVRATLTGVFFTDPATGWAIGHDAAIIKTTDGGKTWELQHWAPELEKPLLDLYFFDGNRGIAVGAYGLYLTTADGGGSWTRVDNEITAEEWHFNSIVRLGDGSMLIAGEAGGIAHSKDEGATWTRLESPYEGTYFGALPRGDKGALLFGLRGNVYVTDDVAAAKADSWRQLPSNTVQSFLGGTTMPDGSVLLVGINGIVAKGDGNTLELGANPQATSLSAAVPLAGGGALAVGEKGSQILTP